MTGQKISIVSPKQQTTRNNIKGIVVKDNCQLIFVDTPGLFIPKAKNRLEKIIVDNASRQLGQADLNLLMIDVDNYQPSANQLIIEKLKAKNLKTMLLLNKIDLLKDKRKLLELSQELSEQYQFLEILMISSLKGDGIDRLEDKLVKIAKNSPFLYPEDQISDLPLRFLAAELTREQIFLQLRQELPYAIAVLTENFKEDEKHYLLEQVIYVQKESQKKIVIGKNGLQLKSIGKRARLEIAQLLGRKVFLKLFVKVKADWPSDNYLGRDLKLLESKN